MITPSEVLANLQCDFINEINSSTHGILAIMNLSGKPLASEQGSKMGILEQVDPVGLDDPVWPAPVDAVMLNELTKDYVRQRKVELGSQLVIDGREKCGKIKHWLLLVSH